MLLIAHSFPPMSGPAALRVGKFVKYLRPLGWEIDVVSVKNIMYHSFDYELAEDCRPDRIFRTPTWEIASLLYHLNRLLLKAKKTAQSAIHRRNDDQPDYKGDIIQSGKFYFSFHDRLRFFFKRLIPPDEKIGWLPFARRKGLQLLRKNKYDYIMTSIGPYTSGILACQLSKKTGVPLVIDYRDHWTLHPNTRFITPLHRRFAESNERKILRHASLVLTVGHVMREELLKRFCNTEEQKIAVIYNGYDETVFTQVIDELKNESTNASVMGDENSENIIFTYTGSLYQPITPLYFLSALKLLKQKGDLPSDLLIRFVGNYHKDIYSLLDEKELAGHITIIPNLPHKEALKELMRSDVLLLFLSTKGGRGILTSKVFEYLRSGKPIVATIPENAEVADILKKVNRHYLCPMEDIDGIAGLLLKAYQDSSKDKTGRDIDGTLRNIKALKEFSRENQTEKLNTLLRENKGLK